MNKALTATVELSSLTKKDTFISIVIIGLLFFIFGFVSWVNAILIPYFKIACGIWPLALDGLGKFIKVGASILIMGLCGNAILPLFYGYFADIYNVRIAYSVLIPCYMYLIYYAIYGHKVRRWQL